MTRGELLHLLIGQGRTRGFEFRRWFVQNTGETWSSYAEALQWLAKGKRAQMLLFSHEFAKSFFQSGERIQYVVEPQTFERVTANGQSLTVNRKAHLRHSSREDVWRFHLREMAVRAEPLHYIRRFLITEETMAAVSRPTVQVVDEDDYDNENLVRETA
ncbi:hypothetical protein [Terriglobus roseus]|uniref:Uncharacterized protein n=1 Tax=Terriglobus roseus TaxID=392734 RepID=A0A1G7J4A6_9BACT|nr:hypothetical protein [Terriglobus roseus]SDF19802.1 hypothetical protein SAMN05444167_1687 [Terriglobus roseus]